jgi:hypothetical protein
MTGKTYCTQGHADGEHDASCMPPADPSNPELRLIRAIFGLCAECDRTDMHGHAGGYLYEAWRQPGRLPNI